MVTRDRAAALMIRLPPPPWIVGHRGAAGEVTENTLEAFLLAVDQGADMLEMDLQLTADGVLAVFHDWDLERLAGRPGVLETMRWAELRGVEIGDAAAADRRHALPRLEDVLERLPPATRLNLELKRRSADPAALAAALVDVTGERQEVLVSSFDWELLAEVRRQAPGVPLAPLGRSEPADLLSAADALGAFSVHCRHSIAEPLLDLHRRQPDARPVLVYTVNEAALASRLFSRGVAGVFTDHPARLRAELGAVE